MSFSVKRMFSRVSAIAIGAALVFTPSSSRSQDLPEVSRIPSRDEEKPGALTTPTPPGVSVPDSPGAVERLNKAQEKEQQRQWKTAAEFYHEALSKYSRRVVPGKIDKTSGVFQYVGVAQIVQERLAKWPDEGLNVYRNAYATTAADLLAAARRDDLAALENVFWTYFVTDAGKSAGIRLMDLQMEAGRFPAAAWIGGRLLALHPSLGADRSMVLFRTALAAHWTGDAAAGRTLADELKLKHAADVGTVGGREVLLSAALTSALQSSPPQPTTRPTDADFWPSFGGPGGRGEISPSTARPGLSSITVALTPPKADGLPNAQRDIYRTADEQDVKGGQAMGIMPVADGGAIFFQDGRRLYAVSADSGYPLSGWAQTYSGARGGQYTLDAFGRARGEQLTVTVTSDRVLAVMGQPDRTALVVGQNLASAVRLVCLDRSSGRELWTRAPGELPDAAAPLRTADFSGTPLVVSTGTGAGAEGDSVLIIARGGKGNQFEDCYVLCLALKDGHYKWSTYIGSASRMADAEMGADPQGTSQLCLSDGRVFALSNLGTIAALDPYDGRMIWLSSYPRDMTDNPEQAQMFFRNRMNAGGRTSGNKPWANNPVVVTQGRVFALPTDGKHLLIFDAGSGAELKRVTMSDYDNADMLLGVKDGMALLTTEHGCYCIDWTRYNHDEPRNAIVWISTSLAGKSSGNSEENAIYGRGFVTSDSIFLPTRHRLYQIAWQGRGSGKVMAMYPAHGAWEGGQGPGNVLVTAQNVIVAGSSRVDVYRDLELVRRQNEQRIAESPNDPEPRVNFAKALFTGGQTEAAIAKLDEAINLIGGPAAMRPGKGREVIFTTTLGFAERSARDTAGEMSALTEKLYERAASAADTALQRAVYRLSRARYAQQRKVFADAVKLCQEVLSDEAMRSAALSEDSTAGGEAEETIAAAVRMDGSAYASVEREAGLALVAAKSTGEAQKLLAVAGVYPNSKAAAEARETAAELFERASDHRAAIDTLRQMYAAAVAVPGGDEGVKARQLEAMARNFLGTPNGVGPAIDRLARATKGKADRRLGKPLSLPDSGPVEATTLGEALTALRKLQADIDAARLADFHIPNATSGKSEAFASAGAPVIRDVTTLVRPLRDFSRHDRVVTWSATVGLCVYAVGEITPLSTVAAVKLEPRGLAWVDRKLLVWTAAQVVSINEAGAVEWTVELQRLATLVVSTGGDAVSDEATALTDEGGAVENAFVANAGPRIVLQGRQRILVQGGVLRVLGQANAGGGGAAAPAMPQPGAPDQVVSVRPAGNRIVVSTAAGRLFAVNSGSGQVEWQIRPSDSATAQVLANAHFTIARVDDPVGAQLVVLDTASGRVIGRRKFGGESSPTQLVNAALSEDGTLVWTLINKLLVKDLYEPWKLPPTELSGKPNTDLTTFAGLNQPEHLLVKGGRVIALYDNGRLVSVYNLASTPPPAGANPGAAATAGGANPLATGANANSPPANIALRMVGQRLFISNGRTIWQYNLADPADHYDTSRAYMTADTQPRVRELFLGRDHSIVVNDPVDRGPLGSPFVQLMIYRRGPISARDAREASILDYDKRVSDKAGILSWQAVEGGLYYLSGDQLLHFLQARR